MKVPFFNKPKLPINVFVLSVLFLITSCHSNTSVANGAYKSTTASYYADKFVGRKTANGEIYSQNKLTAAHVSLPLGTKIEILNVSNGKRVEVKINDRKPHKSGRDLDLSKAAFKKLGQLNDGIIKVKYRVIR